MPKISLLLVLILVGCAMLPKPSVSSQWAALREVDSLTCQKWPLPAGALGVKDLRFVVAEPKKPPQLTMDSLSRSGQEQSYAAPLPVSPSLQAADFAFEEVQAEEEELSFERDPSPAAQDTSLALSRQRLPSSELESWAVLAQPAGFLFAYVAGDSLAGGARLHIESFRRSAQDPKGKPEPLWQESFALNEAHVGELRWLEEEGHVQLVFLKWLDVEATLARYAVTASAVKPLPAAGVFPSGSALLSTVQAGQNAGFYAIIRYPEGLGWQFELCHLAGFSQ